MWPAGRDYRWVRARFAPFFALRRHLARAAVAAGLVVSAAGSQARAEATTPRAVHLDVRTEAPGTPFSAAELVSAVRLRMPVAASPTDGAAQVVVSASARGLVVIERGDRRREVDVGAAGSAAAAARLVALMIVDLVRPDLSLPPAGRRAEAVPVAATAAPPTPARLSGAIIVALSTGITDAGAAAQPMLEARLAVGPRWRSVLLAALDGAEVVVRGAGGDSTLGLVTLPLRPGIGLGLGAIELRAGGLVRPYLASGAAVGEGTSGVLWGLWAAVAFEAPVRGALVPVGVVGLDLSPQTLVFQLDGQTVLATQKLAPWLGVGLRWRGRLS